MIEPDERAPRSSSGDADGVEAQLGAEAAGPSPRAATPRPSCGPGAAWARAGSPASRRSRAGGILTSQKTSVGRLVGEHEVELAHSGCGGCGRGRGSRAARSARRRAPRRGGRAASCGRCAWPATVRPRRRTDHARGRARLWRRDVLERGARLERELLVRHRLERQPVQRRDAEALDRGPVLGRRVADVGREVPARVARLHPLHEAVAGDLGDRPRRRRSRRSSRRRPRRRAARSPCGHREAVGQAQAALGGRPAAARRAAPRGWSCAGRARRSPARSAR